MEFVLTFLEGIASFISPCLLPMLPIYISYFAGDDKNNLRKKLINSLAFILGFTTIFIILSVFASTIGALLSHWIKYIKILFGIVIIFLGFNYLDLIKIKFLNKSKGVKADTKNLNFIKSFVFGILFSISWTPCIGTFLSGALLLIAKHQNITKGILLMLTYSAGLGIPFVLSVLLIEKLKNAFNIINKHYEMVKIMSGVILIVMGVYTIFF